MVWRGVALVVAKVVAADGGATDVARLAFATQRKYRTIRVCARLLATQFHEAISLFAIRCFAVALVSRTLVLSLSSLMRRWRTQFHYYSHL